MLIALIRKHNIFECYLAAHLLWLELERTRFICDVDGHVQVLKDAVEQCQRTLNINLYVEKLSDRKEESALQGGKGYDGTKGHANAKDGEAVDNLPTGHQVDDGGRDREEGAHKHKEPAPDHLLAHLQIGQLLILFLEALLRILLATKGFHQQNTTHRQRF